MEGYAKPTPTVTPESRPFWEACRQHRFLVQRCLECGAVQHYPRGVCARCWGDRLEWRESAGRGRVHTFTVTERTQTRGFRDEVPYVVALVELAEGVQVLTNLVGIPPRDVRIGMEVAVTYEDVDERLAIPRFRPA